jgi:hypothetical protein
MEDFAVARQKRISCANIIREWFQITRQENRTQIKNNCLKRTDLEISRIQKEYEAIIRNLETVLSSKLQELDHEK